MALSRVLEADPHNTMSEMPTAFPCGKSGIEILLHKNPFLCLGMKILLVIGKRKVKDKKNPLNLPKKFKFQGNPEVGFHSFQLICNFILFTF